tara:strand:- start:4826 stop:5491 length:666 start_codon:yes stop_codon:yes gene_type:complete
VTVPESNPRHPNIQAALAAAAAQVRSPDKGSYNSYHQYSYTSAEDMIQATKRPLSDNGLTVRLGDVEPLERSGEAVGSIWPIKMTFLIDWEGGQTLSHTVVYPAMRDKGRPWDKAVNAALTNMTSYWLRGLLNIPRGLGPAVDDREDADPMEELKALLKERLRVSGQRKADRVLALLEQPPLAEIVKDSWAPQAAIDAITKALETTTADELVAAATAKESA